MVKKKHGVIIETPTEARQAEPGPSVLLLLTVSMIAVAVGIRVLPYLVLMGRFCATSPRQLWALSVLTIAPVGGYRPSGTPRNGVDCHAP